MRGGVLGDHSLDLTDPRDLSTGLGVLGDLYLDWGDLLDLSTGWGVLGTSLLTGGFPGPVLGTRQGLGVSPGI